MTAVISWGHSTRDGARAGSGGRHGAIPGRGPGGVARGVRGADGAPLGRGRGRDHGQTARAPAPALDHHAGGTPLHRAARPTGSRGVPGGAPLTIPRVVPLEAALFAPSARRRRSPVSDPDSSTC